MLNDVSDDGEVECELDKIVAHRDTKTGHRAYHVQWRGLPPRKHEWLTASKVQNASDVMQDYLDELSNRGRQAARVGRPDNAAAQGDNAVGDRGIQTVSQDAAAAKLRRGRGCPRKTSIMTCSEARRRPAQKAAAVLCSSSCHQCLAVAMAGLSDCT